MNKSPEFSGLFCYIYIELFIHKNMKPLKDNLFKLDVATLIVACILMICNFIFDGEVIGMILLILTSMNLGVILFNLWLGFQLKKVKHDA